MRLKFLGCLFAVLMLAGVSGAFAEVGAVPTAPEPLFVSAAPGAGSCALSFEAASLTGAVAPVEKDFTFPPNPPWWCTQLRCNIDRDCLTACGTGYCGGVCRATDTCNGNPAKVCTCLQCP
jgi:hypothetical protein